MGVSTLWKIDFYPHTKTSVSDSLNSNLFCLCHPFFNHGHAIFSVMNFLINVCKLDWFMNFSLKVKVKIISFNNNRKDVVYRVNRIGPRTEPWGTTYTRTLLTLTQCFLSVRYDLNQSSAIPDMPKAVWSLFNKTSWSKVSKAALRSNKFSRQMFPLTMPFRR